MATPTDLRIRHNVRTAIHSCTSCQLHKVCVKPVPFSGPCPSRIMIVGEAPGRNEDQVNAPFVGVSGQLLKNKLKTAGFDLETLAFANVVCCFPRRTPTPQEVAACRSNLVRQIDAVHPEFILVVGGVALSAWWPSLRISDTRGIWWSMPLYDENEAWVLATWHPAAVLRNARLHLEMNKDITEFRLVSRLDKGLVMFDRCPKCRRRYTVRTKDEFVDVGGLMWCRTHDPRPAPPKKKRMRKKERFQVTQGELLS